MNDRHRRGGRRQRSAGFTLVELLIVIFIILLVSAVTLPLVVPALANRQVSEAARILQAGLAGARDAAIRANAPRGIRLLPDPTCGVVTNNSGTLFYNRFIPIEPAPDLSDDSTPPNPGSATFVSGAGTTSTAVWTNAGGLPPAFPFPLVGNSQYTNTTYPAASNYRGNYPFPDTVSGSNKVLLVEQAYYQNNLPPIPNPPTSWFWNVRIGDTFRFQDSGHVYTIVGPMTIPNPELFVNDGTAKNTQLSSLSETYYDVMGKAYTPPEGIQYLFLVDGVDNDGDGYIDNGANGLNENQNTWVDANNVTHLLPDDLLEWSEVEAFVGLPQGQSSSIKNVNPIAGGAAINVRPCIQWTISRRPVPSSNGQETTLPGSAVIEATTWNTTAERSRLPIDPNSFFVDIMINPSGQVIPTTEYSSPASVGMAAAFYHFWIGDRTDAYDVGQLGPVPPTTTPTPLLPIPAPPSADPVTGKAIAYPAGIVVNTLKKDRQLVTLFARNGAVVTNSIENFNYGDAFGLTIGPNSGTYDVNLPFDAAQFGIREAK
jgi:prepilin-type N-terminal cleavage/methylation domain-containing protein